MANCKFCGRPVRSAKVFNSTCWELECEKVAHVFCDEYCRWPRECTDEDILQALHCSGCALVQLVNLGL